MRRLENSSYRGPASGGQAKVGVTVVVPPAADATPVSGAEAADVDGAAM